MDCRHTCIAYYVQGDILASISGDYLYSELITPVFTKEGKNVKVSVSVKFLDNQTKAAQVSQFELALSKDNSTLELLKRTRKLIEYKPKSVIMFPKERACLH